MCDTWLEVAQGPVLPFQVKLAHRVAQTGVIARNHSSTFPTVRSFGLILTRNNRSELKTSAWGIVSGGYVGLVCGYTLCDRLPALPDWLSGDCNASVVHDDIPH